MATATLAGTNVFVEQVGSPQITVSKGDVTRMTRVFRGATSLLELERAKYPKGTEDSERTNLLVSGTTDTEDGPYSTLTVYFEGREPATGTFDPKEAVEDTVSTTKSVDITLNSLPITVTYYSQDIVISYFTKTRPVAAAAPTGSTLVATTAAPIILSVSPATEGIPVVTTNYTIETKSILLKIAPVGEAKSATQWKVTESWCKIIKAV